MIVGPVCCADENFERCGKSSRLQNDASAATAGRDHVVGSGHRVDHHWLG